MRELAKVKDILPLADGLFSHIDYQFWDFDSSELDLLLLSRCGQRLPAPLLDIIQGPPDDPFAERPQFTDSQLTQLGQLVLRTYKFKWDKLGGLHAEEYDILKNYLDEYEEVLKDDDSSSLSKSSNRADRGFEVSQQASNTGSTVTQQTENSNETESTRKDNFSSDFTRVSTDNTTRTDNLSEAKTETEDTDVTRTDNLLDSGEHSNTDSQSHQGGNYTEQVTRQLASTGGQDGSTGVYGFNSSEPVKDSATEVDTATSENETTTKVLSGTKSDSVSRSGTDEVSHTGTQTTVTDTDKSSTKLNTGTQTVAETISLTDSTVNVDDQVNTTVSGGTSSASNESSQRAASSNDVNSGSISQLSEGSVVNRALNRARKYIHKGNIGNLTPQQLIQQEIDLWRWNFIEEVLDDVKNFITIPIYS